MSAKDVAETYYDSSDADRFYFEIWGGEDIHVGIYERADEPIADASRRTVEQMANLCNLSESSRVLDLGAGYGGAARYLASRFGCRVTCLNLSETQNARNRQLTAAAGLADRVDVLHASFESVPRPDASYDLIWSQDAILHSPHREQVVAEARRVLAPGGSFVLTDPMQADDCPPGVLSDVLARIHLPSLASFAFYREQAQKLGLVEQHALELTKHLVMHYDRVRQELRSQRTRLSQVVSQDYLDRMEAGLGHWVTASERGHLAWGILKFGLPN